MINSNVNKSTELETGYKIARTYSYPRICNYNRNDKGKCGVGIGIGRRSGYAMIQNNNNNKFQAFDDEIRCQQVDRIGDELQITVNSQLPKN